MQWAAFVGFVLTAVGSCSASVDAEQAQAWALGDGIVTQEEYHTAVDRFIACMRDAGFESTKPIVSPIDGATLLYDVIPGGDPAAWNETIDRCNTHHVSRIEPAYVESQDHVMVAPLRQAVAGCVTSKGFKLAGEERNATDFVAAAGGQARPVMECVVEMARELFPELPSDVKVLYETR
jgi:hypothetical protein